MNGPFITQFLSFSTFGYNPEYENLSDQEKTYMNYVDKCLNDPDEDFSYTCTLIMLSLLRTASKLNTDEEPTSEELQKEKEKLLEGYSEEDRSRLESFMFACIQTMGIYSEESVMERKLRNERND